MRSRSRSRSGAVAAVPSDRRGEGGSTLLLIPVGLLIMFLLGAIAVDAALRFQDTREVVEIASGLANDAAGAVDVGALYDAAAAGVTLQQVPVDRQRLARLVAQVEQVRGDRLGVTCDVDVTPTAVAATCRGTSLPFFAPGTRGAVPVEATVEAVLTPPP